MFDGVQHRIWAAPTGVAPKAALSGVSSVIILFKGLGTYEMAPMMKITLEASHPAWHLVNFDFCALWRPKVPEDFATRRERFGDNVIPVEMFREQEYMRAEMVFMGCLCSPRW